MAVVKPEQVLKSPLYTVGQARHAGLVTSRFFITQHGWWESGALL